MSDCDKEKKHHHDDDKKCHKCHKKSNKRCDEIIVCWPCGPEVPGPPGPAGPRGPPGSKGATGPTGPCCEVDQAYVYVYNKMDPDGEPEYSQRLSPVSNEEDISAPTNSVLMPNSKVYNFTVENDLENQNLGGTSITTEIAGDYDIHFIVMATEAPEQLKAIQLPVLPLTPVSFSLYKYSDETFTELEGLTYISTEISVTSPNDEQIITKGSSMVVGHGIVYLNKDDVVILKNNTTTQVFVYKNQEKNFFKVPVNASLKMHLLRSYEL